MQDGSGVGPMGHKLPNFFLDDLMNAWQPTSTAYSHVLINSNDGVVPPKYFRVEPRLAVC